MIYTHIPRMVHSDNNLMDKLYTERHKYMEGIWEYGSDAEVVEMVELADEGMLDLSDYWEVGQERQITLEAVTPATVTDANPTIPSQTVTFVLLHQGDYELVDSVQNTSGGVRNTCGFVVGMKNCLSFTAYLRTSNSNTGSWSACELRSWCNSSFYSSIPVSIRSIFKEFKTYTGTYNSSIVDMSEDYFALPAEKELFLSRTYSTEAEYNTLTSFSYYQQYFETDDLNISHVKILDGNADGIGSNTNVPLTNRAAYKLRSPQYNSNSNFAIVTTSGTISTSTPTTASGISLFGCI